MPIIDFHTHAFPDDLAARAVPAIAKNAGVPAMLDGKVVSLLKSMDQAGIERSVVCSIATKPAQFQKILDWSKSVRSSRLVLFPSIHPADPEAREHIRMIHAEGFLGIKLHPYYQEFDLDEPRMEKIYECMRECGLLVFCHTGFDVAFPRECRADPERIWKVITKFPGLKFVATHMGAWEDWNEVERWLIGKPVLLETSFSIPYCGAELARRLLMAHPPDCILFGTDSPWAGQADEIERVKALDLPADRQRKLFYDNARRLLGV
ncbi:MAG: amidohydrolase family protein [Kiritimatiellae bacterium]|nr:amidohydrolase family protein [Verrucomicrobiota bacterium]MCG2659912.1 amidohydrolase family protein [Kiritimatiellia bacterium]